MVKAGSSRSAAIPTPSKTTGRKPGGTPIVDTPPAAAVYAGVGRRDITPPVGIYARMWGAAKHDLARGTHRPLSVTALAISQDKKSPPLVLIAIDLALIGNLGAAEDEERMLGPVRRFLGGDRSRLIINCSHTHSAPWASLSRSHMPGGHLLGPYQDQLGKSVLEATQEAVARTVPATFTWATGRCSLATNRDFPDPDPKRDRVVCGYNPGVKADDTVLVGRVTRDKDNAALATVVNYACHPTTLAWLNDLISPDFIGTLRETVEGHTGGAPCLFLQGASGEMAPAHQYVGDPAVADQGGRQLGFAVLSALESMLAPRQRLTYQGVVESGAPLAWWLPEPFEPPDTVAAACVDVDFPIRPMPTIAEMEKLIATTKDRPMRERYFRRLQIVKGLEGAKTVRFPAWVWRVGQAIFIAHPNEAYSVFQIELRKMFPGYAVVVMNVCGSEMGYVSPAELYAKDIYQVWQTPFDKSSLKLLTKTCAAAASKLVNGKKAR